VPSNLNPRVAELLSWHGHDRGGVRVPFQGQSPLVRTIRTPILERLSALAASLARGEGSPRWIFLVGGPGNGKSEAVQSFLSDLDASVGASGGLVGLVTEKFRTSEKKPRRIDVPSGDFAAPVELFSSRIGRLIIIQDASASEDEFGNAALSLCQDVAALQSSLETPAPVFVVCANRGLLARAIREAHERGFPASVLQTLLMVSEVTAVGQAALSKRSLPCWPTSDTRLACWPLDAESLFDGAGYESPPGEQILEAAASEDQWETAGRCGDCDARNLCPFRQNALWLRDVDTRRSLVTLVRRAELGGGRRLTFRDSLSLAAELVVGEWDDFGGATHPCQWAHERVGAIGAEPEGFAAVPRASDLLAHLYPYALFSGVGLDEVAAECKQVADDGNRPTTAAVAGSLPKRARSTTSNLRSVVLRDLRDVLDPAADSPADPGSELRRVEDDYSQSVHQGNVNFVPSMTSQLEQSYLKALERAEAEWTNVFDIDYSTVYEVQRFLRSVASILVKRSLGARKCHHAFEGPLGEYHSLLRSHDLGTKVRQPLLDLLGKGGFRFGPTETFGRPINSQDLAVVLEGDTPGIQVFPAPGPQPDRPIHDLPVVQVDEWTIPLTFDLFLALRLRWEGCANSSLPASVRAALDRVRHRRAGTLCRDEQSLSNGRARFRIRGTPLAIELDPADHSPRMVSI
jgi:hypothetical protein